MRNVAAFAGFTEAVALDGLGQNDGRAALVIHRRLVGRVNLLRVVTAAQQLLQLVVGQVTHEFQQLGILAEEMFADVTARLDRVLLEVAVHGLFHPLDQKPALIRREQRIPIDAPNHFDDVPACAAENPFQFLDDLAVAAHGTVKALQIAVHHPDQIIEAFAGREGQRTERFRFIRFAVADEAPDFRFGAADETARFEVAIEPRLINRTNRAEPHRDRRELPEIRHQIRMRIGG